MARILFLIVFAVAVNGFRQNPKFPKFDDKKVGCTSASDKLRHELIEKSRCGEPKEVFQELKPPNSFTQINPSWVWVKRCVGLCDLEGPGSQCVPVKTRIEAIPVRIFDLSTSKDTCTTIKVEVHESCGCCSSSSSDCGAPKVFDPRKCSCHCPNKEERRNCLKKVRRMMDVCDH
ncbi:uncharacterized protein LOC123670080 [Melitaea cinxia]|uniref:uncharacterized protein LOC123670080 n=1 Tax=Melitaea cinxia TaxID=113334 RepID=UPI001E274A82|nr:uncharacterized protein LOC123670080 [Melitaea cinxia]